jgi:hypothetical protein
VYLIGCYSGDQIKEREMWRVWGEKRNAYRTSLVKHERKKLHGRSGVEGRILLN